MLGGMGVGGFPSLLEEVEQVGELEELPREKAISTTPTTDTHLVEAHQVSGYEKENGTFVEGYWRDGDGNTSVDKENAAYQRSNPDNKLNK